MRFPESFTISKGKPLHPEKYYRLTDLGFEYDIPYPQELPYDLDMYALKEKTSDREEFTGYKFWIQYINTLISKGNRQEAIEATFDGIKHLLSRQELDAVLESCGLLYLLPEDAECVVEEFEYLITKLLPRDFGDLFSYIGLEYRICYVIFYKIALKRLGLVPFYGYYNIIKSRILQNETLISIYRSTCLTKEYIRDAVHSLEHRDKSILKKGLIIEKHLFSKKEYYEKCKVFNGITIDFVVYKDDKPQTFIIYDVVTHLYFNKHMHKSRKHFDQMKKQDEALSEYCKKHEIELLRLDSSFFEDGYCKILRYKNRAEIIDNVNQIRLFKLSIEAAAVSNRNEIEKSNLCGCVCCQSIFPASEVTRWVKESAVCPKCDEIFVIGDAQGFDITPELLGDYYEDIVLP